MWSNITDKPVWPITESSTEHSAQIRYMGCVCLICALYGLYGLYFLYGLCLVPVVMNYQMKHICPCLTQSWIALAESARETVSLPRLAMLSTSFFSLEQETSCATDFLCNRLPVLKQECSCGSGVEHCVSSAKVVGSIPREHTYWQYKCITWMHCKLLWIKASAKCKWDFAAFIFVHRKGDSAALQ